MSISNARTLLAFADVQLSAEAIDLSRVLAGEMTLESALVAGNNRNSRFTDVGAMQFAEDWEIAAHQPNTDTGFSGTLFRYKGEPDAARGLTNGELVLSFRSTEFVDDAARDSQATNAMEVRPHGWAFGQIDDMERWFETLRQPGGALHGQDYSVTGYSLGGHLATAFNLLRQEDGTAGSINATYTFNGAGVGEVLPGSDLTLVLEEFRTLREGGSASRFTDDGVRALYLELRPLFNRGRDEPQPQLGCRRPASDVQSDRRPH